MAEPSAWNDGDGLGRFEEEELEEGETGVKEEDPDHVVKALYELRRHWDGSIVWTNTIPKQEKAEDVGRKALAGLILRYVKSERDDGEIEYELSSVIIRSTNLRKALDEALAGEEVVHFGLKRVQIDRPFQPFLRQWPRMQAKLTECTDDSPPCRMFRQFHDIIFTEIESTLNEIKDLVDHKVIKSEHVWALFEPEWDSVKKGLVERGRKFAGLSGYHIKAYKHSDTDEGTNEKIIIDAKAYYEFTDQPMNFEPSTGYDDSLQLLGDDEFVLCNSTVKGFSLLTKAWGKFEVDQIENINWNKECISNLVLPNNFKELLLSLVEQKMTEDTFDDVIEGKGRGLIILLSGNPGVGKTMTAEAIAESMELPLYPITAGEIAYSTSNVEGQLRSILQLASKLKAVLLLDERDVFLARRSLSDVKRNELVAIFLRQLEYYAGVLIITTNRTTVIDPAIRSRIHIAFNFPGLDFEPRRTVWSNFIRQNGIEHDLSEEDMGKIAKNQLNGREIKNVNKSALLISRRRKVPLSVEHIKIVTEILKASTTGDAQSEEVE